MVGLIEDGLWITSFRKCEWNKTYYEGGIEGVGIDVAPLSCYVDSKGDGYAVCRRYKNMHDSVRYMFVICPARVRTSVQEIIMRSEDNEGNCISRDVWRRKLPFVGSYPAIPKPFDAQIPIREYILNQSSRNDYANSPSYLVPILSQLK